MASKAFQKDMDAYLEKKVSFKPHSCQIHKKSLKTRIVCWFELVSFHIKDLKRKFQQFFQSNDDVDLQSLQSDVVVIKSFQSPASHFMKKLKKFFGVSSQKEKVQTQREQPEDIDPQLIEQMIQKNK